MPKRHKLRTPARKKVKKLKVKESRLENINLTITLSTAIHKAQSDIRTGEKGSFLTVAAQRRAVKPSSQQSKYEKPRFSFERASFLS